jgi:hypothetical protein
MKLPELQGETLHVTVSLTDDYAVRLTDLAYQYSEVFDIDIRGDATCDPISISASTAVMVFYNFSKAGTSLKNLSLHGYTPTKRVGMKRYLLKLEVNPNAAAYLRDFAKREKVTLEEAVIVAISAYFVILERRAKVVS